MAFKLNPFTGKLDDIGTNGGSGSSPWTDSGTDTYLTTTTDDVIIGGTSALSSAKFSIDGDTDQIQAIIQGNSTQTSDIFVVERSNGNDLFRVDNDRVIFRNQGDTASNEVLRVQGNNRTTAADGDEAYFALQLENSSGTNEEFARITWEANDVTAGTKDGELRFGVMVNDTLTDQLVINESGVGVGETSPTSTFDINGSVSVATETVTASSDTLDDTNHTVLCDCTSNAITINLPAASGVAGRTYHIKKIDSTANAVTVDGNGAETIDGAATLVFSTQYTSYHIICDGTEWHVI